MQKSADIIKSYSTHIAASWLMHSS